MSSNAKNYAIAFLALTTVGGAALVVHTRQQLAEALNAPSLKVTRSEFSTAAAPAPLITPAVVPEAPEPDAVAERPEPGQEGPGFNRGGPRGGGAQFAAQMATLMQDPEFTEAWKLQQEARIERRYGALFKDLNLPPDQLATLKSLLAERENAGREVWATAAAQGLNPRESRDQLRELTAEFQAEVDANIANTVGPNVVAAIEAYNNTGSQRNTVNEFSERLSNTGQPLNDSQSRQLTAILAETGQQQGRNTLITDATITRAAGVLTHEQLTQLKAEQAVQQANQIVEAKTRAAREAAREAARAASRN